MKTISGSHIIVSSALALCIGIVGGGVYGERSTRAEIAALPTQTPVVVTRTVVVTPTPLPGLVQVSALAALPTGQCVVGMPDEDMRIATSGHGAQKICRDLMQHPRQGI